MSKLAEKLLLKNELGRYGEGNIDLYKRPQIKNQDGKISTVKSYGFTDENGNTDMPVPPKTPSSSSAILSARAVFESLSVLVATTVNGIPRSIIILIIRISSSVGPVLMSISWITSFNASEEGLLTKKFSVSVLHDLFEPWERFA